MELTYTSNSFFGGEKRIRFIVVEILHRYPINVRRAHSFGPCYLSLRCLPHPHDQMGAAHVLSRLKQMKSESVEVVGEAR